MEPISLYSLTAGLSTVSNGALSPFVSWVNNRIMKWKLKKRLSGLCLAKGCSTLCNRLSSPQCLFVDLDLLYSKYAIKESAEEEAKNQNNIIDAYLIYPLLKQHVLKISEIFRGKIVLVSKSLALLQSQPIYKESITLYAFSKSMEENVKLIFESQEAHTEAMLNKFRYMREIGENNTVIVESLIDLEKKVKEHYKITDLPL